MVTQSGKNVIKLVKIHPIFIFKKRTIKIGEMETNWESQENLSVRRCGNLGNVFTFLIQTVENTTCFSPLDYSRIIKRGVIDHWCL